MSFPSLPAPPADAFGLERRRMLGLLACTAALAACGGGGGDSGAAPAPSPGPVGPSPAVDGPAWWGFGRDAQHAAQSGIATQALNRIAWQTPIDLAPPYSSNGNLLAHYGSPVCTNKNTVIVPVKTGNGGGFRIEARAGGNGVLLWQADSDYVLPPGFNWVPSWNLALSANSRLVAPAAGGRLLLRDNADSPTGTPRTLAFYGDAIYAAQPSACNTSIYINTPPTVDAAGNVYFGFVANGGNPAGLVSGIARVAADGTATWVGAAAAASDSAIAKVATNCAPALSPDGLTLYVAVNVPRTSTTVQRVQRGVLLALDSRTLATKSLVALLEPSTGQPARVSDDGTSSPTVGPDGDVYYGVLEASLGSHNARGWLLHFDSRLAVSRIPGSFGWDDTASVVPASAVPGYTGGSSYLLMTKYNDYEGAGSGLGDNRIALLDPFSGQADRITPAVITMREVLTILGPTPEGGGAPGVKEWCINTAAIDVLGKSVLANSEDGWLYRWDLTNNSFSQRIQLTTGLGEAYTPTAIGADGAVYAVNNAILFCVNR